MKKLFKKDFGEEHNFWMSYTDLMSGFLVVFIILSAILYNHYNDKVAEAEKAQQEAVVKQDLYEEALASLERASLDLEQQADIIDSLKQNNLKNLIRRYHDVFVYDEYVKVTFDTIRGQYVPQCVALCFSCSVLSILSLSWKLKMNQYVADNSSILFALLVRFFERTNLF